MSKCFRCLTLSVKSGVSLLQAGPWCFVILALALVAASEVSGQTGLVGHWTFDDTLNDSVGTADGIFSDGTPTYVNGMFGKAVRLDGINDHVVLGDSSNLNFGSSTDFSIAIWVRSTGWNNDAAIISNKNWYSGSTTGWIIAGAPGGTGSWQWNYRGASGSRVDYDPFGPTLSNGQWHHLCVTHDRNGYAAFYFDGEFQDLRNLAGSTGTIDAGYPTVIGTDGAEGRFWPYWFAGSVDDVRIYDKVLSQGEIDDLQSFQDANISVGPYVQFTGPYSAVVRWNTQQASDTIVEYGLTEALDSRVEDLTPTMTHEITLVDLEYRTKYFYRVGYRENDVEYFSDIYPFDTAINYAVMDCSALESPHPNDSLTPIYEAAAQSIIEQTGITKGYCLVYGCGEGRLAFELARRSDLMILGVDTDAAATRTAIQKLMAVGVYGSRVKIQRLPSLNQMPLPRSFFNLVVSERMISDGHCVGFAAEMFRVLRPSGGTAYLGQPRGCPNALRRATLASWLKVGGLDITINEVGGLWAEVVRPALPTAGEWPRQYGGPDNAAYCGDDLEGATRTNQMTLQWIGSPGSDFGADRQPRMPAPVMAKGRLYHQGLDRVLAMDSYNGAIYWSLEVPELLRVNMPRDSGYTSADGDGLFVAVRDACWCLNGDTGFLTGTYSLDDSGLEWGYVALSEDKLFGSAQYTGAHYSNIWGAGGWYDGISDSGTYKVCSKYLFADYKKGGTRAWTYQNGIILNSTITMGGGRIYFVECRHPSIVGLPSGRIGDSLLWSNQYLVALDEDTGVLLWEKPINTADGTVVFFMQYTDEKLFISLSNNRYYIYAYDAANGGTFLWSKNHSWTGSNHSGHMQHPVIVGSTIFLEPHGYDIDTGNLVTTQMGRHEGCATYAGTTGALVYRGSARRIAMWDIQTGAITTWTGLRPSCWLSTIVGGGMVLSPEGGGGCSCNGWLNTSIGFIPAAGDDSWETFGLKEQR